MNQHSPKAAPMQKHVDFQGRKCAAEVVLLPAPFAMDGSIMVAAFVQGTGHPWAAMQSDTTWKLFKLNGCFCTSVKIDGAAWL